MNAINLYLTLGTVLFGLGLWGVFTRRNAIAVLMAIELMLNGVNINFVAAQRFGAPGTGVGQLFAIFVLVVAAAEVAVGLALIISIFRLRRSVDLNDFNLLKW